MVFVFWRNTIVSRRSVSSRRFHTIVPSLSVICHTSSVACPVRPARARQGAALSCLLRLARLGRLGGLRAPLLPLRAAVAVGAAEDLPSLGANVAFTHEEFSVVRYPL